MVKGGDFRMVTVATVMTTMASDGSQPQTCSRCPAFAITRSTLPGTLPSHSHFTDGKAKRLTDAVTCSALDQLERQDWHPGHQDIKEKGIGKEEQWHRSDSFIHSFIHACR